LKQLGLACHNYGTSTKVFPPGIVMGTNGVSSYIFANYCQPWAEAAAGSATGYHGTSWILRIMPYIEGGATAKSWNYQFGVNFGSLAAGSQTGNVALASMDVKGLYCPTRRSQLRQGIDEVMMLSSTWTGGGTDYGGCVGRFDPSSNAAGANSHNFAIPTAPSSGGGTGSKMLPMKWSAGSGTTYGVPGESAGSCQALTGLGIFGQINQSTSFASIRDGTSNTILTGELQRIVTTSGVGPYNASTGPTTFGLSHDGWAIGGDSSMFTTDFPVNATTVPVWNNGCLWAPGSEHSNGANFGMGDGSVRYINTTVDPAIFVLLGSMADRVPATLPE
jgi:prepilin-type processing-associated H-X9-DG protein